MFLRRTQVTSHGRRYEYVHLVESYRRESDGRPTHRIIANLGKLDDNSFQNLKAALDAARVGKRVAVVTTKRDKRRPPKPQANLRYLDVAVADELWREWELPQMLRDVMPQGDSDVAASQVVQILASQRLVAPDSKLAATRWFPHTALPELLGIEPRQLNNTRIHRVLEQLEAATPTLMAKLPQRYRERDGAFVSLFMDVTDAWFVGRGPEFAAHGKTKEGMVRRKVNIVLLCNERGYPLRWTVVPGKQHDSVAMTDMMQAVSGLGWVAHAPVVVDRAMGTTAVIRTMAATGLRFLTALSRTEFSTYAPELPWKALQGLVVTNRDRSEVAAEAARRAEKAGMDKVDSKLLVLDFGVVVPSSQQGSELAFAEPAEQSRSSEDPSARAMRLCRQIEQAVADGRISSYAAAGATHGLKRGVTGRYRKLRTLAVDIQQRIVDGEAARWSLESLIRIAELADPQAQRAAFDVLLRSTPTRRASRSARDERVDTTRTEQGPAEPLRVRVVVYFNPEQFVEQRRSAGKRLQRVADFVADLNGKLASPRARRTPAKILAAVDSRLRKDALVEAFEVTVGEREIGGRSRYQVEVELDEAEWHRRRRYDGFSVLVGHAALPHDGVPLCQLYRAKDMVEKDFQVIKGVTELRPIRHRTDPKVSAHVTLCMLALLLERTLRDKLADTATVGNALEALERCRLNRYRCEDGPAVYTVTETDKEQRALLRKLRLQHLADDDHLAARITPR